MRPQFLVIGHTVQDLLRRRPDGLDLGGATTYAAVTARNLGMRAAILTAASPDLKLEEMLPDIDVVVVPSRRTTQMRNVYSEGPRRQFVPQRASTLTVDHLPSEWKQTSDRAARTGDGRAGGGFARSFGYRCSASVRRAGCAAPGRDNRVRPIMPADFHAHTMLRQARALFLSDEDIRPVKPRPRSPTGPTTCRLSPSLAATTARTFACAATGGNPAFPPKVVDPTGAGDVFAAAFLIRLWESGDVWKATRFAACAASYFLEGHGIDAIPTREQMEARLKENPGIVAR